MCTCQEEGRCSLCMPSLLLARSSRLLGYEPCYAFRRGSVSPQFAHTYGRGYWSKQGNACTLPLGAPESQASGAKNFLVNNGPVPFAPPIPFPITLSFFPPRERWFKTSWTSHEPLGRQTWGTQPHFFLLIFWIANISMWLNKFKILKSYTVNNLLLFLCIYLMPFPREYTDNHCYQLFFLLKFIYIFYIYIKHMLCILYIYRSKNTFFYSLLCKKIYYLHVCTLFLHLKIGFVYI